MSGTHCHYNNLIGVIPLIICFESISYQGKYHNNPTKDTCTEISKYTQWFQYYHYLNETNLELVSKEMPLFIRGRRFFISKRALPCIKETSPLFLTNTILSSIHLEEGREEGFNKKNVTISCDTHKIWLRYSLPNSFAEVEGFKPPIHLWAYTGFRVQRIRSLCHTSLLNAVQK